MIIKKNAINLFKNKNLKKNDRHFMNGIEIKGKLF